MKTKITSRLLVAALFFASLTGCKKLWEEERLEITRCPQTELQPEAPDWDEPVNITDQHN